MPGSLISQKNITNFFVCNEPTADLYNVAGTDVNAVTAGLTSVMDTNGKTLTWDNTNKVWKNSAGTIVNKVRFAVNTNSKINISDDILWDKVTSRSHTHYAGAAEQVDYIGYNGTSGSIDVTLPSTNYIVRIELIENQKQFGSKAMWKIGQFKSTSTSPSTVVGQQYVAAGLVAALISDFQREPEKRIKFERVYNATFGTTTASITANYGSKTLSGTGVGTFNPVGSVFRLGTSSTTSTAVYVCSQVVDANTIIMDVPFQGTSATNLNTYTLTVAGTLWGIKLTGILMDFDVATANYEKSRWKLTLNEEFGTTTLTNSVTASYGSGTYYEVAELEWFLEGNQTRGIRHRIPPYVPRSDTSSSINYDIMAISWQDDFKSGVLGQSSVSFKTLMIAVNTAATTSGVWEPVFTY